MKTNTTPTAAEIAAYARNAAQRALSQGYGTEEYRRIVDEATAQCDAWRRAAR
jgi:hypothetical protein